MTERATETAVEQCRYMAAAYPTLDAADTCGMHGGGHRHDEPTFALARAMAVASQHPNPSDEQIAWFLDDAGAVVDFCDWDDGILWRYAERPPSSV